MIPVKWIANYFYLLGPIRYQSILSRWDISICHCWISFKSEMCWVLLYFFTFFISCVFCSFFFCSFFYTNACKKYSSHLLSWKSLAKSPVYIPLHPLFPKPSHTANSTQKIETENKKPKQIMYLKPPFKLYLQLTHNTGTHFEGQKVFKGIAVDRN